MKELNEIIMKTNNRSYRNVINDTVAHLDRLACNPEVATEEMMKQYSGAYLLTKCVRSVHDDSKFEIANVRYGRFDGHLYGFDIRLKLQDADIALRVMENKEGQKCQLLLGGYYSRSLRCASGAYIHILEQLYDCAAAVKVAA